MTKTLAIFFAVGISVFAFVSGCSNTSSSPIRNDQGTVIQVLNEAMEKARASGSGHARATIALPSDAVDYWIFVAPLCTEREFDGIKGLVTKSTIRDMHHFSEFSMEHAAVYRVHNKVAVEYSVLPSARYALTESVFVVAGGQSVVAEVKRGNTVWLSP